MDFLSLSFSFRRSVADTGSVSAGMIPSSLSILIEYSRSDFYLYTSLSYLAHSSFTFLRSSKDCFFAIYFYYISILILIESSSFSLFSYSTWDRSYSYSLLRSSLIYCSFGLSWSDWFYDGLSFFVLLSS